MVFAAGAPNALICRNSVMAILARDQAKESRFSVLRTRALKAPASRVLAMVVILILVMTATGTRAPAIAQTAVKFSLDFKIEGPAAPFLIGIDRGYYKAGGLDVTIDPSPNSLETINRLASGTYDIGVADINLLIRYRTEHPDTPMRAVFMVYNRPPFAIVARKSRGISKPQDLEGKRLGAPTADTSFAQWPVFAHAAGIDPRKVTIENVGFPVREPMLAAGQVDAITGFSFVSYVDLKDRNLRPPTPRPSLRSCGRWSEDSRMPRETPRPQSTASSVAPMAKGRTSNSNGCALRSPRISWFQRSRPTATAAST
jgi:hypothetical protein